jgi:hypothetical protein
MPAAWNRPTTTLLFAQLGPKWRVIECRDGAQWILQRKSSKWGAHSYCRTSAALERVVREHVWKANLPPRRFFPCANPRKSIATARSGPPDRNRIIPAQL